MRNDRIVDAFLLVLHKHKKDKTGRKLRSLVTVDFERIKEADQKFTAAWKLHNHLHNTTGSELLTYYNFRIKVLDQWQKKHKWHHTTRNLYGSILSTLVNWRRFKGIPREDQDVLLQLKPGADLILQFLDGYEPSLI